MAELGNHHLSFPSQDNNSADDGLVLGPFGAGVSGTITEFHIYAEGAGGPNVRPMIYASDGSDPGALVTTLPQLAINASARWWDVTGLSVAFTGPIYIGWWQQSSAGFNYFYNGAGPGFYKAGLAAYHATNPAPTPWPKASDAAADTQSVAIYVVYTPLAAPSNDTPASVTGTTRVGQTLTADAATSATRWTGETSVAGKWQNSATSGGVYADIASATASTYILQSGDLTKYIRYLETATNTGGSTSQASNIIGPVTAASSGGASTAAVSHAAVAVEIILI